MHLEYVCFKAHMYYFMYRLLYYFTKLESSMENNIQSEILIRK